jgi:glucosamine--fructose-6-phosphate aminotransferase (isomerizing)
VPLREEIAEQPDVVRRLLAQGATHARAIGRRLADAQHLTIAARGSSDNAATYGKYLFEAFPGLVTALAAPSLVTLYGAPPAFGRGAVIGISQSGSAPDVAAVLAAARSAGARTLAITNAVRSRVARSADDVFPLRTGPERSIAATKTYTGTCAALALIAAACARAGQREAFAFDGLVDAMREAVALEAEAARLAGRIGRARSLVVLARGFAYASALEAALKIKELARVWAEPYSAADFAHGPIALLEPGTPVLLLAARGATERAARILARRLAADLARRRGLDPDRPAGLTKVTRTR